MVSAWFMISVDSCSISLYWALPFMVLIRVFNFEEIPTVDSSSLLLFLQLLIDYWDHL
jgi:hypothetical protein